MMASLAMACENQEPEFPDFDYTTGYFPYQFPVRTLVLGDYIFDNTNDNNHKFLISAAMGGVYSNDRDRVFTIEVAPSLCEQVRFESTQDPIRLLPAEYYTLSSSNTLTIKAGEINGSIEVQLNDAFFDDPLSHRLAYVIPIRIVSTNSLDSVLRGQTAFENADPRIAGMWDAAPKDFTMFAVNYINKYHGTYLHRGANTVRDASNAVIESNVYRTEHIVNNNIIVLETSAKNQVTMETSTRSELYEGVLRLNLTFADDETCSITSTDDSDFPVTGTGRFVDDGDEWGEKKRDAIHISYQFTANGDTYTATDTLVVRDRAVKMQLYTPEVY